jgi:acetyl-CoA carboxylase carboxyltransferase component
VLSARSGKNLKPQEVGGYSALQNSGIPAIEVGELSEVSSLISRMTSLLDEPMVDAELNESVPSLNEKVDAKAIVALLEDAIELGANSSPEVKTVLGRVGGIAVAAVVFDKAVKLNEYNVKKIKNFAEYACCYGLPFVTFVDCVGVEASMEVNNSAVLKEIAEYLSILDAIDTAKVAVVTGSAVGLGYSLFAAKSVGFDYTYAFATAKIALFESGAGAQIVYQDEKKDSDKLVALYDEQIADPFNAAQGGYLDNIIEPQFVKQYLVASLQMLMR